MQTLASCENEAAVRRAIPAVAFAAMIISAGYVLAAPLCGDVDASGKINTSDALLVLQKGVGQSVDLTCGPASEPLKTGQTVSYSSGDDGDLQAGVARSFTDNGDGTITDNATGLMWEKLSYDGSIHDWGNYYTWEGAFTSKVATLNSTNFAGHSDWRAPNIFELESLRNMGTVTPATYAAFNSGCVPACTVLTCSCTQSDYYWSSSTLQGLGSDAWIVNFFYGASGLSTRSNFLYVRAVRSGS